MRIDLRNSRRYRTLVRGLRSWVVNYKIGAAAFGLIFLPLLATATSTPVPIEITNRATTPVTLIADDRERVFQSGAPTVAEALAEAGVALGEHDAVTPALESMLTGVSTTILVERSLPTTVIDSGVVVSRTEVVPGPAAEMLARLGIPLAPADIVVSSLATNPVSGFVGQTVSIERQVSTATEEISVPTIVRRDRNLPVGTTREEQAGVPGRKEVTFRYLYRSGEGYVREILSERVIAEPVARIAVQGTKVAPQPNRGVRVPGDDVWAKLRQCEAGGDYTRNSGNGYYGAYQFDIGTWGGYGGYSRADLAPLAVQDAKARDTQARRGWSPWPACARALGLM